jgi:hypothetical protein
MEAGKSETAVQPLTGTSVIEAPGFTACSVGLSHHGMEALRGRGVG